jgi:hypothetical protein
MRHRGRAGNATRADAPPIRNQQPPAADSWLQASVPGGMVALLLFRGMWAMCLLIELHHELPRLPGYYGPGIVNFKYPLLPLPTPSLPTIKVVYGLMAICAVWLVLAPWCRWVSSAMGRAAAAVLGLLYGAVFLLEAQRYNNHYYLSVVLSGWFALVGGGGGGPSGAPRWALLAVQLQLAAVYFYGGVAKLSDDWLSGATMLAMGNTAEHGSDGQSWSTVALTRQALNLAGAPPSWSEEPEAARLVALGGCAFDLLIGPLLLQRFSRWLRYTALAAAAVFHALNALGEQQPTIILVCFVW